MELRSPANRPIEIFSAHVDRLCLLIVASDCSDREIDIERLHLRVQAAALFPEEMPLYEMVYESRFRRLRQQFFVSRLEDKNFSGCGEVPEIDGTGLASI